MLVALLELVQGEVKSSSLAESVFFLEPCNQTSLSTVVLTCSDHVSGMMSSAFIRSGFFNYHLDGFGSCIVILSL